MTHLDPPTEGGAAAAAPALDPAPRTTQYHAATGVPRAAYDDLKLIVGVDFTHGGRAANSTSSWLPRLNNSTRSILPRKSNDKSPKRICLIATSYDTM